MVKKKDRRVKLSDKLDKFMYFLLFILFSAPLLKKKSVDLALKSYNLIVMFKLHTHSSEIQKLCKGTIKNYPNTAYGIF